MIRNIVSNFILRKPFVKVIAPVASLLISTSAFAQYGGYYTPPTPQGTAQLDIFGIDNGTNPNYPDTKIRGYFHYNNDDHANTVKVTSTTLSGSVKIVLLRVNPAATGSPAKTMSLKAFADASPGSTAYAYMNFDKISADARVKASTLIGDENKPTGFLDLPSLDFPNNTCASVVYEEFTGFFNVFVIR
jgi:hypothetical protein